MKDIYIIIIKLIQQFGFKYFELYHLKSSVSLVEFLVQVSKMFKLPVLHVYVLLSCSQYKRGQDVCSNVVVSPDILDTE